MKPVEIKGIIPPVITPMDPRDESVNIPALRDQIERQIAAGVHGIFPLGTNGEAYILDLREKEEVLEAAIDQVRGRVPVYAGTGCISTRDTVYLSRRAQQLGADALSVITPSFAAASQEELYQHYRQVAEKVDIPIILYNIPARTGNRLLPETVARLAREVDLIRGAKDSSGDLDNLRAYIQVTRDMGKDFSVLAGNDGNILACLQAGERGAWRDGPTCGPGPSSPSTTTLWPGNWKRPGRPRRPSWPSSGCSGTATPTPSSKRGWPCWATRWATAAGPSTTSVTRGWRN